MACRAFRPIRPSLGRLASPRYTRQLSPFVSRSLLSRPFSTTALARQEAFHSQQQQQRQEPTGSPFFDLFETKTTPQTLTEKILQRHAVALPEGKVVLSGDYITIKPHRIMTHENSAAALSKFEGMGASKVADPDQIIMTADHQVQDTSETNLKKYKRYLGFAAEQGIRGYPPGAGIGHQLMVEDGHAWPGTLTVASDSHSNMYGGIGAVGMAVVRTDAAAVWATGKTWFLVPPVAKITFTGILPVGVTGKDVIVALCGLFNQDEVLNHAIEFAGSPETLASLSVDERLSISNMTTEFGALAGIFPIDSTLERWMRGRATTAAVLENSKSTYTHERIDELMRDAPSADHGATYAKHLYMNLSTLSPFVSGPNSVKIATQVRELEKKNIKIDKAYLVSCTNARASDMQAAARVFREAKAAGREAKVAPGVELYIAAASMGEQRAVEETGDWQVLLDAGAQPLPSGCGPCIGLGRGLAEQGDTVVSASNRNFVGRMGHRDSQAYLGSPEVVAASALAGKITGPGWYQKPEGVEKPIIGEGTGVFEKDKATSIEDALEKIIAEADSMISGAEKGAAAAPEAEDDSGALTEILPGFPEKVEGEIVFCDADNINTDGIYPGKYTYQEDITREQMAEVVMENFDKQFATIAKPGDILVGGSNFGSGSSREQAATAILAKDIPLVVSASFANIFQRNSINNALMLVEVPKLVERLRETFKVKEGEEKVLTRRTGWRFEWDVRRSKVTVTEGEGGESWSQKVGEVPPTVQDIAKAGLEAWVKNAISSS